LLINAALFILGNNGLLFAKETDSVSSLLLLGEYLPCQLFVVWTPVIVLLNDQMVSQLLLHGKGFSPLLQGGSLGQIYILGESGSFCLLAISLLYLTAMPRSALKSSLPWTSLRR